MVPDTVQPVRIASPVVGAVSNCASRGGCVIGAVRGTSIAWDLLSHSLFGRLILFGRFDLTLGLWCRVAWCCYTPEDLYRTGFSIAVRGEIDDLMIIDRTLHEMVGGRFLSHSLKDLYRD